MKSLLKTKNLSKSYDKGNNIIHVLDEVNISINEGEIVALMGPSGSGKSSLLNILGTLDNNYKGDLYIDNTYITNKLDLSFIRASKIGFVFQFHHLLSEFTVLENLQIPQLILNQKINTSFIMDMLSYIGLKDRKNHYPDEISGGERQRVAIVRSLVNSPKIILADEPSGNLDSENSQLIINLILELRKKYNQSFLIATHDNSISKVVDRILNLGNGKIIESVK